MASTSNDSAIIRTLMQKFREGESIIAIFEAYQIIGSELPNRLLVIVSSTYTSALFSFNVSNYPPVSISDLTINSAFPINESFWVDPDSNFGSGSFQFQFKIFSENEQHVFHYYPNDQTCQSKVNFEAKLKELMKLYQAVPKDAAVVVHDFKWLDGYKRADLLAIDRNIADGTQIPKNRDSKFREELEKRRHEYLIYEPYKIYTATWNVNGKLPEDICLREWLSTIEDPPDIYAVGFQEIDLSAEKIIRNETRIDRAWVEKVMEGLHPCEVYEELISVRLVGMMLTVAVKSSIRNQISRCLTGVVGTGTLKMGNKGGVGVSFQLNEAFICFVNSHLAAHTQEFERRNEDHDEIIRRMAFDDGFRARCIFEHDHIYWVGDLNYRLDAEVPIEEIKNVSDYNLLYKHDQLYVQKLRKRIFVDFKEGKILFCPTYKYNPGSDDWDSSEKSRSPAWCDRILWKGQRTELLKYDSVMQIRLSDHKPVYAVFITNIETKDENKFKKIHEEVLKTVDKYENDNQPQITVEQTDIDFGLIRFNELYSRELLVANNCHLPVHFKFSCKDEKNSQICEEFIHINYKSGELLTGSSLSIRIDILVDAKASSKMLDKLKGAKRGVKFPLDILVLHIENGRDIFITIFGDYKPSCFGVSIETLMKLNKPVIDYELTELLAIENDSDNLIKMHDVKVKIPRELWLLVDYLYKNGLQTPNLFTLNRKYAKNSNVLEVRDWLDSWSTNPFPGTPYTAAETLLLFLESLPLPVVTISERECFVYADLYEKCREMIRTKLSPAHKNVFIFICLFLAELKKNYGSNRLDDKLLSNLFGKSLIRAQASGVNKDVYAFTEDDKDRRKNFLLNFLIYDIREFTKSEQEFEMNSNSN